MDNLLIALTIAQGNKPAIFRPAISEELREQALAHLRRFGIEELAQQKITAIPQGMRKLVDIAMATVSNPSLVFLDEPTSGVSADEKMEIMRVLIEALKSAQTAVLFIEHDMDIIEAFSPRVVAFYEGTILADAPTTEVLRNEKVKQYVIGHDFHSMEKVNKKRAAL